MRIASSWFIAACVLIGTSPHLVAAAQAKYGVTVQTVNAAGTGEGQNVRRGRSLVRRSTRLSTRRSSRAVDRELSARGFTKLPSGPSDVSVTYSSVSRTDLDLKKAPKEGVQNELAVGTLVLDVTNPTTREVLFRVRADTPIERDSSALETVINAVVTAMFEKYPSPPKR